LAEKWWLRGTPQERISETARVPFIFARQGAGRGNALDHRGTFSSMLNPSSATIDCSTPRNAFHVANFGCSNGSGIADLKVIAALQDEGDSPCRAYQSRAANL
jgi:hypothetical protein